MPAKPVQPVKPTVETALAGFQQLFGQMKNQSASWINYVNLQGQSGNFDILRMLKSAFFMQALANRELFTDYSDRIKLDIKKLGTSLEANNAVLVYAVEDDNITTQYLYVLNTHTVFYLKKNPCYEWVDIVILTFDRSLLDGPIKQMLHGINDKEKDVQVETNQTELPIRNS